MDNSKDLFRVDDLFDEANKWFFRLQAEDVTEAEKQRFSQWLNEDPARVQAWNDVHAFMRSLQAPARQSYDASRPASRWSSFKRRSVAEQNGLRQRRTIFGLATCCLMLIVGTAAYVRGPVFYDRWVSDYATVAGERETITLSDGTRIDLNTDTALSVTLAAGVRRVTVLRGEAFFDIAKDSRPFVVVAGDGESRDIGTAFSVERHDDLSTVIVQDGIVDVKAMLPGETVRLTAGESVDYGANGLSPLRKVDTEQEMAWRRGQLIFRQERLSDVVAKLNRYRSGQIIIVNPWIGNMLVSGTFNIDSPEAAINALEAVLKVRATYLTSYVVALR